MRRMGLYFLSGMVVGAVCAHLATLKIKKEEEKMRAVRPEYKRVSVGARNASVRPQKARGRVLAEEAMNYISVDPAELQSPPEDDPDLEEARADEEWVQEINKMADEARGRKPRIISAQTLGELNSTWELRTLYYYAYDDTLVDEDGGEIIDNPALAVGDSLYKYGFSDDPNQRNIIVQNFDFHTVYEVEKVFSSYLDSY